MKERELQALQDQPAIQLKPIISYPRVAEAGKQYLLSIDVQLADGSPWPYKEEEFEISFVLETAPFFTHEPLGEREPGIVLHRFGGTYGAAEYLLTASQQTVARGTLKVVLLNGWGLPIAQIKLDCEVKRGAPKMATRQILVEGKKAATPLATLPLTRQENTLLKDFFISYVIEDRVQAKWICQQLEDNGYRTIFPERDFPVGSQFVLEMQKALNASTRMLAVISPAYLASPYTQAEWADPFRRDPTGEKGLLIPVLIASCEADALLGPILRINLIDLIGKDDQLALQRLLKGVRRFPKALKLGEDQPPVPQQEMSSMTSVETPARLELVVSSPRREEREHNQEDEQPLGALYSILNDHRGEVYSLAWSPDGRYLASAGADKTIFITEQTTRHVFQLPAQHTKTIYTISWSPDGAYLGSGGQDGFIHIWNVASRRKLLTYDRYRNPRPSWAEVLLSPYEVLSLVWSPDGHWIASGGDDCQARVWDALSGEERYIYRGHALGQDDAGFHAAASISSLAWSPDGNRLASASCKFDDQQEQDLSFKVLNRIPGISHYIASTRYSKIHVWDALTGDHVLIYPGHEIGVTALAWSPDGSTIASASKDKTVQVWNPATLRSSTGLKSAIFRGHTDQVKTVAWSPQGTYIASAGSDSTVQVWKAFTGERIYIYTGHIRCVRTLAWSPDGRQIASAGDEGTIHIWKAPEERGF